jgi:hypothetical protein
MNGTCPEHASTSDFLSLCQPGEPLLPAQQENASEGVRNSRAEGPATDVMGIPMISEATARVPLI